jgi:CheY-like chemotaxis protein
MSGEPPIRVLVVDDHRLLAEALVAALSAEPDIEVVGIAPSVAGVSGHLGSRVDVVLMDYMLDDATGADTTRIVKARQPAAATGRPPDAESRPRSRWPSARAPRRGGSPHGCPRARGLCPVQSLTTGIAASASATRSAGYS